MANTKVVGIEGLRFVSALAVLVWHYQHFGFVDGSIQIQRDAQPFYNLLMPLYYYGASGVQVFWCISGYIFFLRYYQPIRDKAVTAKQFAIARFSRLYPLHLLTLILVAGLQAVYRVDHGESFVYQFNDLKHFLLQLGFASHWGFQDGTSFNDPIWSVSVEVLVYALFFATLAISGVYFAFTASLVLAGVLIYFGSVDIGTCILYFYAGGALAMCHHFPSVLTRRAWLAKRLTAIYLVATLVFVSIAGWMFYSGILEDLSFELLKFGGIVLIVTSFVLLNGLFLPTAKIWTFLGNLTYASYLTHIPIQLAIVIVAPLLGVTIDYTDVRLFFTYFGITFVVSVMVFRIIEKPAQTFLRGRLQAA